MSEIKSDLSEVESNLLNKQDKLTVGTGIDITNNVISNKYKVIAGVNLNNVNYNYLGYANNCTNQPSGTATGGTVSGGGSIHKRLDGTYKYTAKATANSGYRFAGWYSDSGRTKLVSSNATYNGTMTAATTLYAKFLKTYTLTLTANPTAGGTLSGGGTYDSGTNVTAKATPATNYKFMGWYSGTTLKSSSESYSFSLTANTSLTAMFNKTIKFKVNGTWKSGVMYIKVNDAWKRADTYIKVNGTWKK